MNSTTTTKEQWIELAEACNVARDAVNRVYDLEPYPVIKEWLMHAARFLNGMALESYREGLKV